MQKDQQKLIELIKGKIYAMSPAPSKKHQFLLGNLHLILGNLYKTSKITVYINPIKSCTYVDT